MLSKQLPRFNQQCLFPCVCVGSLTETLVCFAASHLFFQELHFSISSSCSASPRYSVTPFLQLQLTAVAVGTGGEDLDSSQSSETTPNSPSNLLHLHQNICSCLPFVHISFAGTWYQALKTNNTSWFLTSDFH